MRRTGRTIQGMRSPEDSLRESYQSGRDLGGVGKDRQAVKVKAPAYSYPGRYRKETEDI